MAVVKDPNQEQQTPTKQIFTREDLENEVGGTIKKYVIQQKQEEGVVTLHPQTEAEIVYVAPIADDYDDDPTLPPLFAGGSAQDALDLAINAAYQNFMTKVDKVGGKDLSTNDYDDDAVAEVAKIANKVDKETGKSLIADTEITRLAGISTGANKVEASTTNGNIKIDGVETTVYSPTAADVYTVVKDENSGDYAAIYHLTKNGTNVGAAINIPKDLVVKSGSVITKDGKKYIQLVLNDASETKIEIEVDSLVDIYTSGTGVTVDATARTISIDRSTVDTYYEAAGAVEELENRLATGGVTVYQADYATAADSAEQLYDGTVTVSASEAKAVIDTVGDFNSGLVKDVADLKDVGATKVESSTTNGNIKINGVETTVYTEVENTVHDAAYKHIDVTSTSVTDGTNTFTKYDDTALAGRVTTIEGKFDNAVAAGTYSVVQTNDSGIVTAAGQILEVGATGQTAPSDSLVIGGIFFKEI